MPRTTIRSEDITAAQVKTADMAVDPTNASNLTSGSVPLAQLGNAPATDTTSIEDDLALLGFKVAANGSLAKYNLDDQTVDAFEDATGIDAGASTNAIRDPSGNYYYGSTDSTGGTKTSYSSGGTDYTVHTFTADGTYTSAVTVATDYFIVAGGGSGGGQHGAGGGAGGYLTAAAASWPAGTYTATIGTGGASVQGNNKSSCRNRWDKYYTFWPRWFHNTHSTKRWRRPRCRSGKPTCFLVSRSGW